MKSAFIIAAVFLFGCAASRSGSRVGQSSYFSGLGENAETIIQREKSLQSTDTSYTYLVEIGEGLYPNKPGYKLKNRVRFKRKPDDLQLTYLIDYYTSADDTVRVILHEWNMPSGKSDIASEPDTPSEKLMQDAFDKQFTKIRKGVTDIIGVPSQLIIHAGSSEETERDDVKWLRTGSPQAYLLMFKSDKHFYRQIRLVVYLK